MKSVELKLLVEGVGTYSLFGKTEDSLRIVDWLEVSGDTEIEENLDIKLIKLNAYEILEAMIESARKKYPAKNISTIINYENTN